MPEADYTMTDMALNQSSNARYAGDERLLVQFHNLPMINEAKSAEEGRPIYDDVEHVMIMQPGNKDSIIDRPITDMDKARFRAQYERWKAGLEEQISGTMLTEWPELTRSQVKELEYFHIRTVEQLAELSDANAQRHMGIQTLKQKAKAYLQRAKDHAATTQLQAALGQRDSQIRALQEALTALQAQVKAQAAQGVSNIPQPPSK